MIVCLRLWKIVQHLLPREQLHIKNQHNRKTRSKRKIFLKIPLKTSKRRQFACHFRLINNNDRQNLRLVLELVLE